MQTENNLSFLDLVKKRRTTRKFTEQALTQEEVVDLMKVPLFAPSSRNRQPLQYILVDNKDDLSRLSECKPSGATFEACRTCCSSFSRFQPFRHMD